MSKKERAIEEIYQKKTQHEHIMIRPDTYVGSLNYDK
jgi:DNA topoisomerase-2